MQRLCTLAKAPKVEERSVCAECVGDNYLKKVIGRRCRRGMCDYCKKEGCLVTTMVLASRIRRLIEKHHKVVDEPYGSDHTSTKRGEKNSDNSDIKNDVKWIIQRSITEKENLVEDLHIVLKSMHNRGSMQKNPYDDSVRYEIRYDSTELSEGRWENLQRYIKEESRSFNRKAKDILELMFDNIGEHATSSERTVIAEIPEGTKFFRARAFQSSDHLVEAFLNPEKEFGPPPSDLASSGRLNAKGISVFYGVAEVNSARENAENIILENLLDLTISEVRPHVGGLAIVVGFEVIKPLKLLDFLALESLVRASMFDPLYSKKSSTGKEELISNLTRKISTPVMREDESLDYLITQVVSDYLSEVSSPPIDGILYRSTQIEEEKSDEYLNVMLFHKSSRVEPFEGRIEVVDRDRLEKTGVCKTKVSKLVEKYDTSSEKIYDDRKPMLRFSVSDLHSCKIAAVRFKRDGGRVISVESD